jgi:hypothetical protein
MDHLGAQITFATLHRDPLVRTQCRADSGSTHLRGKLLCTSAMWTGNALWNVETPHMSSCNDASAKRVEYGRGTG